MCRGDPLITNAVSSMQIVVCHSHARATYFETHARLHFLSQNRGDGRVEVGHDTHRKLRLDTAAADQVVQRVGQSDTDPTHSLLVRIAALLSSL